jgi:thiol-disulfide isomerase/thioredoxin
MRADRSVLVLLGAAFLISAAALVVSHHEARASSRKSAAALRQAAQNTTPQQSNGDDKITALYFVDEPEVVPPFTGRDLAGQTISTAAYKGKIVIINFWATWCGPCREEVPEMIALQNQYKDALQIIGVSEDDAGTSEQVAKFVQKTGINYPVIMANDALDKEYGGIPALPTSFLVNKDGRVVQKDVGVYSLDYYSLQVRALLGLPVNARIETFKDTGQVFLKNADRASELPGVSFAGLTPDQKKAALHRLNATSCTCGCQLTLAECRINDTSCPVSAGAAMKIVHSIARSNVPATAATTPGTKPGATP